MKSRLQTRLDRLEKTRSRPGQYPDMMHWPFLLNTCRRPNGGFADEATYTAACQRIGPGLVWPTYVEMLAIWAEAQARKAEAAAAHP